jgi:hypothetical protein
MNTTTSSKEILDLKGLILDAREEAQKGMKLLHDMITAQQQIIELNNSLIESLERRITSLEERDRTF